MFKPGLSPIGGQIYVINARISDIRCHFFSRNRAFGNVQPVFFDQDSGIGQFFLNCPAEFGAIPFQDVLISY